MNPQAAYGLLAHGLLCGALISLLPLGNLRPRAALIASSIALLAGIAPVLHAWFGPPSITLLLLALLCLPKRAHYPLSRRSAAFILACALGFYLAANIWGELLPYALGFQPQALLCALAGLVLLLWWQRQTLWLAILAIDLGVWLTGFFPNLWDVLFDPLLLVCCAFVLLRHALRGRFKRFIGPSARHR